MTTSHSQIKASRSSSSDRCGSISRRQISPGAQSNNKMSSRFISNHTQHIAGSELYDVHGAHLAAIELCANCDDLRADESARLIRQVDPYIDAVQVRNRAHPEIRGSRVEPAKSSQLRAAVTDHEPGSSYYSKSVHVEKHVETDELVSDSDDSDDDDDDYYGLHHYDEHHHKGHYGHSKGNKHKKVIVKKYPKKPKYHGKKYNHHKKRRPTKRKHHNKKHHNYPHGGYHHEKPHYKDDSYEHYKDKYAPHKGKHHHKGKLVHLNFSHGKGHGKSMSVAGLLGYTLLCVNYLLMLQKPTYDKYTGHYFTRYSPYDEHGGKTVELKTGGPVILAHCAELPSVPSLSPSSKLSGMSSEQQLIASSQQLDKSPSEFGERSQRLSTQTLFMLPPPPMDRFSNNLAAGRFQQPMPGEPLMEPPSTIGANFEPTLGQLELQRGLPLADEPQLVQTRDNLAALRMRDLDVSIHVLRRRFVSPQGPVRVVQVQQDGPTPSLGASLQLQQQQPRQILDLPEFALSGDSIELNCNHRMAVNRLYSVKWFKDSAEFYRFIPANGPRAKSALFLPDIRIDLARSNSESLYLRNVTHRSSGLYRCEVVSEGPDFETLSGERRMQVYALPDSGPQLSVASPPGRSGPAQLQSLESDSQGSPLIRCTSSRSNPVAQLKFFINNQPVEMARIVQNSTSTFSDGTESNVVALRLVLDDFKLENWSNQARLGSIERAAAAAAVQRSKPVGRNNIKQPAPKASDKRNSTPTDLNASVQFDEHQIIRTTTASPRVATTSSSTRKQKSNSSPTDISAESAGLGHRTSTHPAPATADQHWPDKSQLQTSRKIASNDESNYIARHEQSKRLDVGQSKGHSQSDLKQQEQRVSRQQTNGPSPAQQLYSNYIRIRCSSLVPAVGYEMTSELNVPLTLLVPAASQIGADIADPNIDDDAETTPRPLPTSSRRRVPSASNSASDEASINTSLSVGSIQAPRAVTLDRLAQPSSAITRKTSSAPVTLPAGKTASNGALPTKPATINGALTLALTVLLWFAQAHINSLRSF